MVSKTALWGISLGIFTVILVLLWLPFGQWGFLHDDFGTIFHPHLTSLKSWLQVFYEPGANTWVQPDNFTVPDQSFFAVLYRPLFAIIYEIQRYFFGCDAAKYLLVMVFFHAINTLIFFRFLAVHFALDFAVWGSLYFAFHLSLWDWMGWIAGLQHVMTFTMILSLLYCIHRYLDTQKKYYGVLALLLLFATLFMRETVIIVPVWLMCITPLYFYFYVPSKRKLFCARVLAGALAVVSGLYLALRALVFPVKTASSGLIVTLNPVMFLCNMKYRFFDTVTFLVDIANLSWLSGGNRLLKGTLLLLIFSLLSYLFYKNSQKKVIILLGLSMLCFMWPAILRYYASRYLYKALPFLIIMFLVLATKLQAKNGLSCQRFLLKTKFFMWTILVVNMVLLPLHMKQREYVLHGIDVAFDALCADPQLKGRPLIFIALPYDTFVTGVAQALRMKGSHVTTPIYYDSSSFIWTKLPLTKNLCSITRMGNQIHVQSSDPELLWLNPDVNKNLHMGPIVVHKRDGVSGKAYDATYTIDVRWLVNDPVFITWDFEKNSFVILYDVRKG